MLTSSSRLYSKFCGYDWVTNSPPVFSSKLVEKITHLCNPSLCLACGACINACTFKAINWRENALGEQIPFITNALCRDCGVCDRVCPQLFDLKGNLPEQSYACWLKSAEELAKSASGGAARALSQAVIEKGGVVFGCSFTDGRNHHKVVASIDKLDELSGSKYVWSDVGYCYYDVRDCLRQQDGRPILFIGTPCQVDGLKHFLGPLCDSSSLFTADLICHGTPPPRYIKEFLKDTEGDEPECLVCRDRNGGALHGVLKNGKEFHYSGGFDCSMYLQAFVKGITYRERCYTCRYATPKRVGDITLGDYWGISRKYIPVDSPEILSIVFLNTKQGRKLFDVACPKMMCYPVPSYEAVKGKANMLHPQERPIERETFLKAFPKCGFTKAIRQVLYPSKLLQKMLKRYMLNAAKNIAKHISQFAYQMFFTLDSCQVCRKENEKLIRITTADEAFLYSDYGLFFQYYALKTVLEAHGCQVYRQNRLLKEKGKAWDNGGKWIKTLPFILFLKEMIGKLRHRPVEIFWVQRFFRKAYSTLMGAFFEYANDPPKICIILGNKAFHTHSNALDVFMDNADGIDKIAVAISANWNSCIYNNLWQLRARDKFPLFKAISVHGEEGKEICQKMVDIPIFNCIDPILLLTRNEYERIMEQDCFWKKKTILCYMENLDIFMKIPVNEWTNLSDILDAELKITGLAFLNKLPRNLQKHVILTSPVDFLRSVRDAEFLVTDCCQGVAFALLFETRFICLFKEEDTHSSQTRQMRDFLSNINALERIKSLSNTEAITDVLTNEIDWATVKSKVETWRLDSLKWLEQNYN